MAPLILHNVPDDECYVGDDGVKRPYAMIFNQHDAPSTRSRRNIAESGSFGKSTRRSRSRTGTPARGARENPTLAAADRLFGDWVSNQATAPAANGRKGNAQQAQQDEAATAGPRVPASQPVEMMLRGYRSATQQYAAVGHYEALAGAILEDYPRDPPATQRRYKSELRDPALRRRRTLTADERALVNRADGGEHWVKVTFETTEAADAAAYASPQLILGHLVHAEPYRGIPPRDEACPEETRDDEGSRGGAAATPKPKQGMPSVFRSRLLDLSPAGSHASSQTMDTTTMSPSHSSATVTDGPAAEAMEPAEDSVFCRRIPTARRARLLPAEQALLPQQSVVQRVTGAVPLFKWFGGSLIGNEVPRTETGEFDWSRASLYWKMIWWLDATFGLFKGDVCSDKEE
ncbi:hypothetical protein DCS_00108 [Drechmeria coniospora]|uniref:Nup53p-like protein n=1 Tax=Drechmeria coniospora TaxID=98403 RepID=A0A151GPJ3_DRECN|nr:hypothetical protein DCS_00108 [Drechmeria coniospora]KYK58981.1 hypothetical protein DCS_00108 [Drechmeria coniospora]